MENVAVLEKLLGMRQVLKLNELIIMSPSALPKNLFKIHLVVRYKKSYLCPGQVEQLVRAAS